MNEQKPPAATWLNEPKPPQPTGFSNAPPAAPAQGASLRPLPAAPALPGAPAQGASLRPLPAAPPQMVPSYVAKAMEREQARRAKQDEMVPAPAAQIAQAAPAEQTAPAPLPKPAADTGARADLVGQRLGAPDQGTTQQGGATGGARADLVGQKIGAPDQGTTQQGEPTGGAREDLIGKKIGAPDQGTTQPEQTTASGVTPPTDQDDPSVVKAKTEAEQTFADLMEQAKSWMNAKEDPAARIAFSRAITQSALVNQEAMNAVRAQIASNPALAGQPAGDALLALRASQIGTTFADLKAGLAIEEQREISRLNQLGFEATMKLNEIRKTDDERNLASFGSVLDEMIRGGADEATLEEFFNSNIKPLLPGGGAGMTLDQFRNPGTRAQLLQGHRSETQRMLREAIAANADQATINQLVSAAYTEDQLSGIGKDWLTGKSLEEVNQLLRDAGYEEIEDLSELIGNEDLVGQAKIVADNKAQINRNPYQDEVDSTLQMLTDSGVILTPELEADVKAYIIRQSLPGADTSELPPWKDDRTAHLYGSWPLPGQTGFGPSIQDTPTSHSAYARNEALNRAWEAYLRRNPDSHVTREEWYNAQSEAVKGGGVTGAALEQALREQPDPKKRVAPGDRDLAVEEGLRTIKAAKSLSEVDFDDPNVAEYFASLDRLVANDITKELVKNSSGDLVNINGEPYIVLGLDGTGERMNEKADYIRLQDKDGNIVWMQHKTDTPVTSVPKYRGGR